jgi:hypothetical protein
VAARLGTPDIGMRERFGIKVSESGQSFHNRADKKAQRAAKGKQIRQREAVLCAGKGGTRIFAAKFGRETRLVAFLTRNGEPPKKRGFKLSSVEREVLEQQLRTKNMKLRMKYIFLTLSLVEFAIGFSNLRPTTFFYLGLPVGAICFVLFLITQLLEKESALLDEQNRAAAPSLNEPIRAATPSKHSRNEVATHPVPTMAHAH